MNDLKSESRQTIRTRCSNKAYCIELIISYHLVQQKSQLHSLKVHLQSQ